MGRDDSYDNQFDNGGYRESSFSNRPPRHDQYHAYNSRHGSSNSPPRINHIANPSQLQRNNDNASRNRQIDSQWSNHQNQDRGWRPPPRDDPDRARAKRPRAFSTDSNGERRDVDRRGSPPHHFQQQARKTPHPQDDVHRKNFQNNKFPQHYHQQHGFNSNTNSNHYNDSTRQRPDSSDQPIESRRNHSFDEKWNREGGGNFGHGQRASTGNTGGPSFNQNNNNSNSRYRNNNFSGDHDDKYHGANRGRHFDSSPKRSTSPNFYRGNRFKSPSPDRRSPRDDSRHSQIPPDRHRSRSRGHRDDREGENYGYRHGSNSSNDQDTSFGKRRRSPSLNSLETRDAHPKTEHNSFPYPPPPPPLPPIPPQESGGTEWGKALHQEAGTKEYKEYPTGQPTILSPAPPLPGGIPPPGFLGGIPPPILPGGIPGLANVLPLLLQLQQHQQLALQQPQLSNVVGMGPPFIFPLQQLQPPPPPPPPIPPIPPALGGAGSLPDNISSLQESPNNQYKIASAMIPPATHTTMATTADSTITNPAKENVKLQENQTRFSTGNPDNHEPTEVISNIIKKEPDDVGDTIYFLPRSRDHRSNQKTSPETTESATQGESTVATSQQPLENSQSTLPSQLVTAPLPPATDVLSAILSDPVTAKLLETIQPFLPPKPSCQDSPPNIATNSKDSSVLSAVQSAAQDATKTSDSVDLQKSENKGDVLDAKGDDAGHKSTSISEKSTNIDGSATKDNENQDQSTERNQDQQQSEIKREDKEDSTAERLINMLTSKGNENLDEGTKTRESTSNSVLHKTGSPSSNVTGGMLPALKPSDRLRLLAKAGDTNSASEDSDMDISSDESEANNIVVDQAKLTNTQKDVVAESDEPFVGGRAKDGDVPKDTLDNDIEDNLQRKISSKDSLVGSEQLSDINDMDIDKTLLVSKDSTFNTSNKQLGATSPSKTDQQESADVERNLKRRQRSRSSPSLSSQTLAKAKLGNHLQQHVHPSWHSIPGSDIALLTAMAGSTADLNRFRRESVWLEDRLRRPRVDAESEEVLDKALGLTRNIPYLRKENETQNNSSGGDSNNARDSMSSSVRLSSESRVAFSMLKTNLMSDLEEQTRLETDYQTLQRALERMQVKIVEKQQLQKEAEQQIQEVASRQSKLEAELQKLREQEEECIRQRDLQRKKAEVEILELHATLLSLQQKA